MSQVIKYESTNVPATKSAMQIGELCQKYGCLAFETRWSDNGRVSGVKFRLKTEHGTMRIKLDVPVDKVFDILWEKKLRSGGRSSKTRDQVFATAERIAWRHMRDLVEQTLLCSKLGLRTPAASFMADIIVEDGTAREKTFGEVMAEIGEFTPAGLLKMPGSR